MGKRFFPMDWEWGVKSRDSGAGSRELGGQELGARSQQSRVAPLWCLQSAGPLFLPPVSSLRSPAFSLLTTDQCFPARIAHRGWRGGLGPRLTRRSGLTRLVTTHSREATPHGSWEGDAMSVHRPQRGTRDRLLCGARRLRRAGRALLPPSCPVLAQARRVITPTRSASEVCRSFPRLRFGLVCDVSMLGESRISPRARSPVGPTRAPALAHRPF